MKTIRFTILMALTLAPMALTAQSFIDSWSVLGNNGLSTNNFLGTTNDVPLQLKVLQAEDDSTTGNYFTIGNSASGTNFLFHNNVLTVNDPILPPDVNLPMSSGGSISSVNSSDNVVRFTNALAINGFTISLNDYTATLKQEEFADLRIKGFTGDGITLATNGKVGVGTTSPSEQLTVAGNIRATGDLWLWGNSLTVGGVDNNTHGLYIGSLENMTQGLSFVGFNLKRENENSWIANSPSQTQRVGGGAILMHEDGTMRFVVIDQNERYRFTCSNSELLDHTVMQLNSGKVQIAPSVNLDVKSHLIVERRLMADSIQPYSNALQIAGLVAVSGDMDVNGTMKTKEVRVTLEDWPDYVFESGYTLPDLQETERYIHDNGHQPNIPSAAEVEQEGIDLGEINKLLLQKIEELTLHIINLQKQINELKGE